MPPPNDRRRAQIADTAIELLVEGGVHGVTHRAVDIRAGLPAGTTSNYFRSREALLVAVTRRVAELHQADMADAAAAHVPEGDPIDRTIALIAASLHHAATAQRERYLAIFELRLESLRRPALAEAFDRLMDTMTSFTTAHHTDLRLDIPPAAVPQLMILYGGALFTLVTTAPPTQNESVTWHLATAIVRGALS